MTVSDFLNVFIQTASCDTVQCVEIPLNVIAYVRYTKADRKKIDDEHLVEIGIRDSSESNYFLNGKAFFDKSAEIFFTQETSEVGLQKMLQLTGIPISVNSTNIDPPSITNTNSYPATAPRFNTLASRVAPLRNSSQDLKRPDPEIHIQSDQNLRPQIRHPIDEEENTHQSTLPVHSVSARSLKRIQRSCSDSDTNRQRIELSDGENGHMTNGCEEASKIYHEDHDLPTVEDSQNIHNTWHTQGATKVISSVGRADLPQSTLDSQDTRNDEMSHIAQTGSLPNARSNVAISTSEFQPYHTDSSESRRVTTQNSVKGAYRIHVDGADQDEWDVPGTPRRLPNQMNGMLHPSGKGAETRKNSKRDKDPTEASDERSRQVRGSKYPLGARPRQPSARKVSEEMEITSGVGKEGDVDGKTNDPYSPSKKLGKKSQAAKNRNEDASAPSNRATNDSVASVKRPSAYKDLSNISHDTDIPADMVQRNPNASIDRSQILQSDAIQVREAVGHESNEVALLRIGFSPNIVQSSGICGSKRRNSRTHAQEDTATLPVGGCPEVQQVKIFELAKAAASHERHVDHDNRLRIGSTIGSLLQKRSLDTESLRSDAPLASEMNGTGLNAANAVAMKEISVSKRSPADALVQRRPATLAERFRSKPNLSNTMEKEFASRIRSPSPNRGASPSWNIEKVQNKATGRQTDPFTQRLKAISGLKNPSSKFVQSTESGISPVIARDTGSGKRLEANKTIAPASRPSFANANMKLADRQRLSGTPCSSHERAASFEEGANLSDNRLPGHRGKGETTPIAIPRKQSIISFSKSGPRNQGTSTNRRKRSRLPQADLTYQYNETGSSVPTRGNLNYFVVARVAHMVEEDRGGSCSPIHSTLHPEPDDLEPQHMRLCSQNTRVTNEGSPIPVTYSQDRTGPDLSPVQIKHFQSHASVECTNSSPKHHKQANLLSNAAPCRSPRLVSSLTGSYSCPSYPRNRKQQPSSPRETSETSCLPAHHFSEFGVIFNPATEETIFPSQPLDPFTSDSKTSSTSFIRMLRGTGDGSRKRPVPESAPERPLKRRASHVEHIHEDPDETLIASPRPLEDQDQDLSLSDSQAASPPEKPKMHDINTGWSENVQIHQQTIREILSETINASFILLLLFPVANAFLQRLLSSLVCGERSFTNIVKDYQQNGDSFVDQFHRDYQANIDSHKATADIIRLKMTTTFRRIIEDLELNLKSTKDRTEALELALGKSQTSLKTVTDATLAKFKTF